MKLAHFIREPAAHLCSDLGVLKKQRALEIFAAVQTRAQNEVAVQQGSGLTKYRKEIFVHLGSARRWRAVFGGPPKISDGTKHVKGREEMIVRRIHEEPFDEPSNGAREPRALPRSGIILPRCVIRGLVRLGCGGNHFDFHVSSSRQRRNLDGGTGRRILFEIRAVYLVCRLLLEKKKHERSSPCVSRCGGGRC